MTEQFTYLCIGCPLGCRMELDVDDAGDAGAGPTFEVRGNSCKKGEEFARQEHVDPRRMVTTTVACEGGRWPRLPVRTTTTVPRDRVGEVCRALRTITVHAPVAMGDVVAADVCGTGADVVATRAM